MMLISGDCFIALFSSTPLYIILIRLFSLRHLLNQAYKEKRVLLTRDAKLFKYQYLVRNQVYRVKNLLKNDQLIEVFASVV